jgi:nucleotide-binding universal stress UspA family protein
MFRKVIVPLDGSELAERAVPYATEMAHAANGAIALIRVVTASPLHLHRLDWHALVETIREADAYLKRVAEKISARVPVTTGVPCGRAAAQILGTIERTGADAVVMTTHARTGAPHLLHGSVAEELLASSPVPVVLVPAQQGTMPAQAFDAATPRAAVALDGSAFAEAALDVAADFVGPRGTLVLVSIVEPPRAVHHDQSGRVIVYLDQQEEALSRAVRAYLQRLSVKLGRRYPELHITQHVRCGEAAPGIIAAALDSVADVVVMASHGRTGVSRAVLGSVAGKVVASSFNPVCLVGPSAGGSGRRRFAGARPKRTRPIPAVETRTPPAGRR